MIAPQEQVIDLGSILIYAKNIFLRKVPGLRIYFLLLEYMNAEVVMATRGRSCWKIKVRCPFCKSLHQHGGGDTDIMLGSRVSHCGRGEYNLVINPVRSADKKR
jgi:hypothetical protein